MQAKHLFSVLLSASLLLCANASADIYEDIQNAYNSGDYATTLRLTEPLLAKGDAVAEYRMGVLYEEGLGVAQNSRAARALWMQAMPKLRRLAEQGDAPAQMVLATAHYYGRGTEQDYQQAWHWSKKAAEQGDVLAQFALGVLYEKGQGTEQSYTKARDWYQKAAEQGHAGAQTNLGMLYFKGRGVPQDYFAAKEWFERAAAQGHLKAKENLELLNQP